MVDGAHIRLSRILLGLAFAFASFALLAQASAQSVGIKWNAVSETTGGSPVQISGYHVGYGTSSRSYTLGMSIGDVLLARIEALDNGKTYFFAVQAIGAGGLESDWSDEVSYFVPYENCTNGLDDDRDGKIDCQDAECPAQPELCDGLDNDCNGAVDDNLAPQACVLTRGVCAGSTKICGGQTGFKDCDASRYGADYQQTENQCDGKDNDCDGSVDEGCPCTVGANVPCSSDVGECTAGQQFCDASAILGPCSGNLPSAELCDGKDNDCDGSADNGVAPQTCPLQKGVCAGAFTPCGGGAGFPACTAASYGPNYEVAETRCDGMDNDCDGQVDEDNVCQASSGQPPPSVDPAPSPGSDPDQVAAADGAPGISGSVDSPFAGSSPLTGCSAAAPEASGTLGLGLWLVALWLARRARDGGAGPRRG